MYINDYSYCCRFYAKKTDSKLKISTCSQIRIFIFLKLQTNTTNTTPFFHSRDLFMWRHKARLTKI